MTGAADHNTVPPAAEPHPPAVTALSGMTWSHPRGYAPLDALATAAHQPGPLAVDAPPIVWHRQPLAGFESRPITQLAASHDLLVLDHPGLGAAVAGEALLPLDDVLPPAEIGSWTTRFIGDAAAAYRYGRRQWAVPIDAATQVCAHRPDLLDAPPQTWSDVVDLAGRVPICIPTKAPHTLLTFLGIAAALHPDFTSSRQHLVDPEAARVAYELLATLIRHTPPPLLGLDPIEVLDHMSRRDDLACSPLLYGYVPYSRPRPGAAPVLFSDAPATTPGGCPGGVLGGTGLAISRHCRDVAAALAHLRQISSDAAQTTVVPDAGGQPAATAAWRSAAVNAAAGQFYRATEHSQRTAWRRPRGPGWIPFQHLGSVLLERAILAGQSAAAALDLLDEAYHTTIPALIEPSKRSR